MHVRSIQPATGTTRKLTHPARQCARRGSVLLVVLVLIAMFTLAAYRFTELMVTEVEATNMAGRRTQTRAMADSGVEYAAAILGKREADITQENLYHNPQVFQGVQFIDADVPRGRGRFSIVAPVEHDETGRTLRYGFTDESGKLNLNTLLQIDEAEFRLSVEGMVEDAVFMTLAGESDGKAREVLMNIPGMTVDVADAILDWIDEDDRLRQNGAEISYYQSLTPPYEPKNGPLETLDELLLVKGVTPTLLFGVDVNRNGLIDPDEQSLATAQADPNFHPLGWSAFLTVRSREVNRRADGSPKIYLNDGNLAELYDALEEEFQTDGNGEEVAQFIVAYRLNGPSNFDPDASAPANSSGRLGVQLGAGQQLSIVARTQSGGGGRGGGGGGSEGSSGSGGRGARVTRGGMDLSGGAQQEVYSIYDLVDAEVEVEVNGAQTTLTSPFTSDNLSEQMPGLLDRLTTVEGDFIEGRVNVNQARVEVLTAIISHLEEFDETEAEELARNIAASQLIDSSGAPKTDAIAAHASTAWLITEQIVDLPQMCKLDRYLTARGDVFRVQSVGYYDEGGPVTRLEAIIDATQTPPKIVFLRDLTELGKGYTPRQLGSSP